MKKMAYLAMILLFMVTFVGCESNSILDEIPEDTPIVEMEDWGITLTATDVTSSGLTLVFTQNGGGDYYTGEAYEIQQLVDGVWTNFPNPTDWNAVAWIIAPDTITEFAVDWSNLHGALEFGTYRLSKEISKKGDATEKQTYYAEFEVADEYILPIYDSEFVNYDTIFDYLENEVFRVYSPYYDVDCIKLSGYKELDGASYFNMTMYYYHYNRDPDTVEHIAALKEDNDQYYQKMYDAYLGEYQSTWVLKAIVNSDGSIELFSDNSTIGAEVWVPTAIEDYVIGSS